MTVPAPPTAVPSGAYSGLEWISPSSPAALGYNAMTGDVGYMPSSSTYTSGRIVLTPVRVGQVLPSTHAAVGLLTPNTVTNTFVGAYDSGFNLLGSTADLSALMTASGVISAPLTAPIPAMSINTIVWLAFLASWAGAAPALVANQIQGTNPPSGSRMKFSPLGQQFNALPASLAGQVVDFNARVPFLAIW